MGAYIPIWDFSMDSNRTWPKFSYESITQRACRHILENRSVKVRAFSKYDFSSFWKKNCDSKWPKMHQKWFKKILYNFLWHMEGKRSIGMAKNREKTWKVIFWKCPNFNGPVLQYMTTRALGYWFIWKFRSIPIGIHWEIPNPYVGSHFTASQSWGFWPIFWSFDPLSGPGLGVGGQLLHISNVWG